MSVFYDLNLFKNSHNAYNIVAINLNTFTKLTYSYSEVHNVYIMAIICL